MNLDRAPEFRKQAEKGRDLLEFENGKVKPGKDFRKGVLVEKPDLGVKQKGRPKKVKSNSLALGKELNKVRQKKQNPRRKSVKIPTVSIPSRREGKRVVRPPDRLGIEPDVT